MSSSTSASDDAHDPLSNNYYYIGINSNWTLLASTKPNPRRVEPFQVSTKTISCVGDHAVVPLWPDLANAIASLNVLNAFLILGCYRIGHAVNVESHIAMDEEAPVVVLLHVRPGILSATDGEALAARILREYRSRLHHQSSPTSTVPHELTVEIAEIRPCATEEKGKAFNYPYIQNAHLGSGSSVGRHGSEWSGSIGAFFSATLDSGEVTKVLLTNHHVASPDSSTAPFPPQWSPTGLHNIILPSPQDIMATHTLNKKVIQSLQTQIDRIQRRDNSQFTAAFAEEMRIKVQDLETQIQRYKESLPILNQDHEEWAIASLAQTSGWRVDEHGCQMDWGVATLIKDFHSPNRLPKWEFARMQLELQHLIRSEFPDTFPSSITAISQVPLQAEDMVVKFGRTSGWTLGVVNGCGNYHFKWQAAGEMSKSLSIVGYGGICFSQSGDSGSIILNTDGEAAALLFAGASSTQESVHGLTFAADIGATIADIERHTPLRNMKLLS